MTETRETGAIDRFRVLAALLVITIHTAPLSSLDATLDFFLTRVLARTAVPFFFLASGFFLLPGLNPARLGKFCKKALALYGAATLVYLPVNLYAGNFGGFGPWDFLREILFDGTFYHLWYLPASLMGASIAFGLLKKLGSRGAVFLSSLLYVLGLLGDSYYGFAAALPPVKALYDGLFLLFQYTRNGLLFAPLFFVLGGLLAQRPAPQKRGLPAACFAVSLGLMAGEAFLLRELGTPRHDSMYLLLPLCAVSLFQLLRRLPGKSSKLLRDLALLTYLLHPLAIVGVRGAAKLLRLTPLLVENSLVHFLAVAAVSFAVSLPLAWLLARRGQRTPARPDLTRDRAWAEVELAALEENARALTRLLPPGCKLMAVVKADAYGHGAVETAACLSRQGVDHFAVATLEEGAALRRAGLSGVILILGYTPPERVPELLRLDLCQTAVDCRHAAALAARGPVRVHLKVDTGMHRLGEDWSHREELLRTVRLPSLRLEGIFTHLSCSDSREQADVDFTQLQLERFFTLLQYLEEQGVQPPPVHVQSSYGLLNYPELQCAYVRAGIALHGGVRGDTALAPRLRPALSLRARIAQVRPVGQGESVGYDRAFTAGTDCRVAVVTLGYGDGFPRALGEGAGCVLLRGRRAPIVGRVCMDQLLVDVTHLPDIQQGDTATLLGADGEEEITVLELACRAGTIPNELLSRLGSRLPRVYVR